jgi:hypothetical protein
MVLTLQKPGKKIFAPANDSKQRSFIRRSMVWIKTHPSDAVFYLGMLLLFFLQVAYVRRAGLNVPYMDKLKLSEYKEIYFNGSFADIYQAQVGGMHWAPIGVLDNLVEFYIFRSNYMRIMYAQCVVFFIMALLMYWNFKDTVPKACRCLFLAPTLQVFTFTKWEITLYASIGFFCRIFLLLIAILLFNKFLQNPQQRLSQCLLLMVPVILFLTGGAYGPAMVACVTMVLLIDGILKRPSKKVLALYGLFIILLILSYVVRAVIMPEGPADRPPIGGETDIGAAFIYIFTHLPKAFHFLFLNLASSVFGNSFLEGNALLGMPGILIGIGVFLAYMLAIVLFFVKKIYERTYVPLLWIGYSLFCICLFMLARINYNMGHWVASRYVYETCFGTLGILWIYIDSIVHSKENGKHHWKVRPAQLIAGTMAVYLLIGFAFSNFNEWRIAPYRRETMIRIQSILLYPEMYEESEFAICQASQEDVLQAAQFYKNHRLSFFQTAQSDYSIFHIEYNQRVDMSQPELVNAPYIRGGLMNPEERGRWTADSELRLFFTGRAVQSDLELELELEPYLGEGQLESQTLEVLINDELVGEYYITDKETLQIRLPVEQLVFGEENELNKMTLRFPDAVSPQALNISDDGRPYAFLLLGMEIKTT